MKWNSAPRANCNLSKLSAMMGSGLLINSSGRGNMTIIASGIRPRQECVCSTQYPDMSDNKGKNAAADTQTAL